MSATFTTPPRTRFRFPLGARVRVTSRVSGYMAEPGRVTARSKSYAHDPYQVTFDEGGTGTFREDDLRWEPAVGMGATMRYVSDTVALVVTRVTPRTVVTQQVETGPEEIDYASDEGWMGTRPTNAQGILDRPIPGTDRRWTLTSRGTYVNQGMQLHLGHSVTRRDWRD